MQCARRPAKVLAGALDSSHDSRRLQQISVACLLPARGGETSALHLSHAVRSDAGNDSNLPGQHCYQTIGSVLAVLSLMDRRIFMETRSQHTHVQAQCGLRIGVFLAFVMPVSLSIF